MYLRPGYLLVFLTFINSFQEYSFQNSSEPEPKIIGGVPATFQSTKHQVSVQVGQTHICGGAIISLTKVLTAAHCLYNIYNIPVQIRPPEQFTLVMGTLNLQKLHPDTLRFNVQSYVCHDRFSLNTLENDIAIMFLHGRIPEFHPTAHVIPLPTESEVEDALCNVNGWGATEMEGYAQAELRTANVNIIHQELCKRSYPRLRTGMICAGKWEGGIDSCQGDSGGPLSCSDVLVGVVSWGEKCGLPRRPGVYTSVFYYRNWIIANEGTLIYPFKVLIILIVLSYYIVLTYRFFFLNPIL